MHGGDSEVLFLHLLGHLLDLLLGVAVNKGLLDVHVSVKVHEDLQFPVGLLNSNIVLLDTFEGQLFVLYEDLSGISSHEVGGELEDL